MRCLSCEHDLDSSSKNLYHDLCSKKLFGVNWTPKILFTSDQISVEAQKLVGKISISGVQPKLSVRLCKKEKILEVTAKGGGHILKPSSPHFPHLAENENLCMNLSKEMSIEIPPHGLLPLADGQLVYLVKRFDRTYVGEEETKIHVEDFAQLLERNDKYMGSIEQIGLFLMRHSEIPFIDTQKLFVRVLFYFLIGNGDAHLKNFAMIRPSERGYRLANAYDIVSSRLVLPNETDETAISINGKKNNITLKDFEKLAQYLKMGDKQCTRFMNMARALDAVFGGYLNRSFLPNHMKERFLTIFNERHSRLFGVL